MPLEHWELRDGSTSCPWLEIESGAGVNIVVYTSIGIFLQSVCVESLVCRICTFKLLIDIDELPYKICLSPSFTSI